ncbi:MAG: SH3 domain-containing protein [Methylophagaceae bacterium]
MHPQQQRIIFIASALLLLAGCASSPTFVNGNESFTDAEKKSQFNAVHFKTEKQFLTSPPQCIAILPFDNRTGEKPNNSTERLILTDEKIEQLRWILYSHLAPHSYQDVELKKVDRVLSKLDNKHYAAIGKLLHCDALLIGEITEYDADFLGLYSQISIGVDLKLIAAKDGSVLWQGHHIAKSHGGGVPITPVDIAVGVYSATENISDEQVVRVEDELFRRLLSTWQLDQSSPQQNNTVLTNIDVALFHVTAQKLFLRKGPGRHFNAQDVLNHNEKLTLLDSQHSPWVQVKVADGQLGYVHNKYIQASY